MSTTDPANFTKPRADRHLKRGPVFLIGLTLGMILFCAVYGVHVLNPTYDAWLMMDRDTTQHYIGWLYYRASSPHFPIGLIDGISKPYKVSVIYSDSIPLLAVFFKLLSPILPETFQYFGLFGITSFGLMGGFSALLIYHLTGRPAASVLFSILFTLSPYMLHRMFIHTALGAQWVIICAMLLWFAHPFSEDRPVKNLLLWTLLLFITSGIHLYLVAIVYIFCFLNSLEIFIKTKKLKWPLINLVVPFITVIANLALLGAFYGGVSAEAGGFGVFGATLLTFFDAGNPDFCARLLPNLPEGMYQFEGYGYLGCGILLLCLSCLILRFVTKKRFRDAADDRLRFWLLLAACIVFFIWAIIPNITLGECIGEPEVHNLFSLWFPEFVYNLLSILRCNGRFIWPVCYSIFLGGIVYLIKSTEDFDKKIIPAGIMALTIGLQLFDLSSGMINIRTSIFYSGEYTPWYEKEGEVWDHLLETRPHVVYMKFHMERGTRLGYAIARKALNAGGDINTFYLARDLKEETQASIAEYEKELASGNARSDVIYIFPEDTEVPGEYDLHLYRINNVIAGIAVDAPEIIGMEYVEGY